MSADLIIEVHGDDHEHAERLAGIVGDTVRGIGLTMRTADMRADGKWYGGGSSYWMDEHGEHLRLVTRWDTDGDAIRVGDLIEEWFAANLWSHHRTLGLIYVRKHDGNQHAIHLRRKETT